MANPVVNGSGGGRGETKELRSSTRRNQENLGRDKTGGKMGGATDGAGVGVDPEAMEDAEDAARPRKEAATEESPERALNLTN